MNQNTNSDDEVCDLCGNPFPEGHMFVISMVIHRVIISGDEHPVETELSDGDVIESYCSMECLSARRDQLLSMDNLRCTYPKLGPIEICSRCNSIVDMTKDHFAWTLDEGIIEGKKFALSDHSHSVVLAILCNRCMPTS